MKRTRFGKYDLIEKIASGGMAEIYLAKQSGVQGFSKIVVIKRIHKHLSSDGEFVAMFINEARVAAQLTHQNIVQIYDFGEINNSHYIAMEYIHGKDLKTLYNQARRTKTPIPIDLVVHIIQQICNGLDYAHRKRDLNNKSLNIVHRDVSPQNVLLSFEGEVKLTDFGIAKAATQLRATQAGTLKGKIAYMSPEQAWGKDLDNRSDVFAIGIIFYEILLNKRLFLGSSDLETLENVRKAEKIMVRAEDPTIPFEIERIIQKSLDRDVTKRYQYAREMYQDLERFAVQNGFIHQAYRLAEFMRGMFIDKNAKLPEPPVLNSIQTEDIPFSPEVQQEKILEPSQNSRVKSDKKKVSRRLQEFDDLQMDALTSDSIKESGFSEPTTEELQEARLERELKKYQQTVPESEKKPEKRKEPPRRIADFESTRKPSLLSQILSNEQMLYKIIFVSFILVVAATLFITNYLLSDNAQNVDETANLLLNCNVSGARIYFDNKLLGVLENKTYLLKKLPVGEHLLYVKADGYEDFSQYLMFEPREEKQLEIVLKPYSGILAIACNKEGAHAVLKPVNVSYEQKKTFSIKILSDSEQTAPKYYLIDEIPVGTYTLEVMLENHPSFFKDVTVLKDKVINVYAKLADVHQEWKLAITSNVADATISINGYNYGQTSDLVPVKFTLPAGNYAVSIQKEGYQDFNKNISLQSDIPLYAQLEVQSHDETDDDSQLKSSGKVGEQVIIRANHSGIIIFVDGHRIQQTRQNETILKGIPPGEHELVAIKTGFKLVTKYFTVKSNQKNIVELILEPSK